MPSCGSTVVIVSRVDSASTTATAAMAVALSQRPLVSGPRRCLSLQRMSSRTSVLGSRIPANACTSVVTAPSGSRGSRTIPAASATIAAKLAWNVLASRQLRCSECLMPTTSAIA
jgi:hypothetical protein